MALTKLMDDEYKNKVAACETRNASPTEKLWGK